MIETERLLVRQWRETDREPFWQMSCDTEVMEHLLPLENRDDSDDAIERQMADQEDYGHCFWAIERKHDQAFLGFCGIEHAREPLTEPEIGWRLRRDAWGQGYAREAAQGSLDWAWSHLDTPTVVAITVPANTRSWGLMLRLGMTRDPAEDFDHPALPPGHPLRRHMLYRIFRPHD